MTSNIRWLGTACFQIVLPNKKTIIIDPYLDDSLTAPLSTDQIESCDYIFLTHGHYDHILDVGKLASRFSPKIFCNDVTSLSLVNHQSVKADLINVVRPGVVIKEKGLIVEVVKGVHIDFAADYKRLTGLELFDNSSDRNATIKSAFREKSGTDWLPEKFDEWMEKYPPGEQLNFVFEPDDGKRIYLASSYPDPSLIEIAKLTKAYITLLQVISGKSLHGLEEQTADFVIASNCKIAVPQHYDPIMKGGIHTDLSVLKRVLKERSNIVFHEYVPGKWYKIN